MSVRQEQDFIQGLEAFKFGVQDLSKQQQQLTTRLNELENFLLASEFKTVGLQPQHPLFVGLQHYTQDLKQYIPAWEAAKQALKPALDLAAQFSDKIMFLVFGKFNAGKSSFCNFIAERFTFHQKAVQSFTLEDGVLSYHDRPFQEGNTETTAHIQGVILDERLVLIDTPGLHSITTENALLTQRFLESADGILWLSNSTSPGQVQELQELAQELRRHKPLLPVITRSDFLDELIVDNDIQKILCNKSPENRALQENDVLQRAQEKLRALDLDPQVLQAPISISVYSARSHGLTEQALAEAGIYRLYQALLDLSAPVVDYKETKSLQVFIHFLEEVVLRDVKQLQTSLSELEQQLSNEFKSLDHAIHRIKNHVWQQTLANLANMMDKHLNTAENERTEAFFAEFNALITSSLKQAISQELRHYEPSLSTPSSASELALKQQLSLAHYESFYLAIEQSLKALLTQVTEDLKESISPSLHRIDEQIKAFNEVLSLKSNALLNLA
ncbi:Predicted GTPase [Oligella urethralis]|uniref:dynamin family protein n=1 Tax=Oligella urethralis TaxID=90245 RepID=UPI000E07CE20|nr:dynamin family protein [Oligella urethralis]SUA65139.1 Predicted GTPase [Oligella urethralis]